MAGISFRAIYKNTSIDPIGTVAHCKSKGVEIVRPDTTFLQIVKKHGFPTRRARMCCSHLKEYKILDRAILGIRRDESTARAERYKEPEICRVYSKKDKVKQYLPILNWTDADVERFIAERGIKCHPLYYDENGNFQVKERLGCIGCPLQSDNGKADFKRYPKLLKNIIRGGQFYFDTHKHTSSYKKFDGSAYNAVFHNLFFQTYDDYHTAVTGGMFPETAVDAKKFLEDYFNIDLTL